MARPERLELPTLWFEGSGSQILSALSSVAYGRVRSKICLQLGYMGYKFRQRYSPHLNQEHPTCTGRKSLNKECGWRVATGAAWLKNRNSQGGREEQKHPYKKKRKTYLTLTGLLMVNRPI